MSKVIPDSMRTGYLFGVKDPDTGLYVYIGMSQRPWEYIFRMMNARSICPQFYDWTRELFQKHPTGVEILGPVVADRYWATLNGEEPPPLPPPHPYKILMEWEILGIHDEYQYEDGRINVSGPSRKSRLISELKAKGHPIFSKIAGRPRKYRSSE